MVSSSEQMPMHEIVALLVRGAFDELLGAAEGPQVDFKKTAYNLDIGKDQIDFVADIASFANARGGVVVIGVETARAQGELLERATRIRGVERAAVSIESYQKFAQAHIYPLVKDLGWIWYTSAERNKELELFAIVVEAQGHEAGSFIVDRATLAATGKATPWAVGWPIRNNADTHWESAARIQQLIATALRMGLSNPTSAPDLGNEEEANDQLKLLTSSEAEDEWPTFVVQAIPAPSRPIGDFYDECKEQVTSWRGQRAYGFDLGLDWNQPKPMGNRLVVESERRGLIIARSGVASASGIVSPDFLGWADSTPKDARVVINPVVLIEFTAEFLRFVDAILGERIGRVGWRFRAILSDLDSKGPVHLRTNPSQPGFSFAQTHPATTTNLRVEVAATGDWEADAFRLLAEIYGVGFGQPTSTIAFADNGKVRMDLIGK